MAFMVPVYTNEPFAIMANEHGEGCSVPLEYASDQEGYSITETTQDKWFCRLSAPGYMDCTDWDGPFDTLSEARCAIQATFAVDPDTGDELSDEH